MITEAGLLRIANQQSWVFEGAELCLYTDLSGLVEAKAYVRRRMTHVGWRWSLLDDGTAQGLYEPVSMRLGVDQVVRGYMILGADGDMLARGSLDKPFEARSGDALVLYPRILVEISNG